MLLMCMCVHTAMFRFPSFPIAINWTKIGHVSWVNGENFWHLIKSIILFRCVYTSEFIRMCAFHKFPIWVFLPSSVMLDSYHHKWKLAGCCVWFTERKYFDVSINLSAWIHNELSFYFESSYREVKRHYEQSNKFNFIDLIASLSWTRRYTHAHRNHHHQSKGMGEKSKFKFNMLTGIWILSFIWEHLRTHE